MSAVKECSCQSARLPCKNNAEQRFACECVSIRAETRDEAPTATLSRRAQTRTLTLMIARWMQIPTPSHPSSQHTGSHAKESSKRGQFAFLQPQQWAAHANSPARPAGGPTLDYILLVCLKIACGGLRCWSVGQRETEMDGFVHIRKSAAARLCLLICGFRSWHSSSASFQGCKLIKLLVLCVRLAWPIYGLRQQLSFGWKCGSGGMKLLAPMAFQPTRAQTFRKANSSGGYCRNYFLTRLHRQRSSWTTYCWSILHLFNIIFYKMKCRDIDFKFKQKVVRLIEKVVNDPLSL